MSENPGGATPTRAAVRSARTLVMGSVVAPRDCAAIERALRRRLRGADHQDVRALPARPSQPTGRAIRAHLETALSDGCPSFLLGNAAAERDPLRFLKLETDPPRHEEDGERDRPDRDPVEPDLRAVRDAEGDEDAVGGAGEEDERDPGEERGAESRSPRRVARPVEQVVERAVAGAPPLERRPREEHPEDDE